MNKEEKNRCHRVIFLLYLVSSRNNLRKLYSSIYYLYDDGIKYYQKFIQETSYC